MGPEDEFEEYDSKGSWGMVFQKIRQEASLQHDFSLKDAKRPEFRGRNRYRDVSPYDHSRVQLQRDGIDYINASLVDAPEANRSYILTQGPLPDTSGHFWLMAWEQNSRAVLMLNRVIEKGQVKCHQYYPVGNANQGEDEAVFEDVDLKVRFLNETSHSYYTVRVLELTDMRSGDTKEVLQFHYTTWPDFGVPQSPQAFLDFLMEVRKSGALDRNVGPPVIHCSAGIGRSGTFCLVDTCLVLIEKTQTMHNIDVCKVLMDMRHFRMGLIQTPDQLRFSYLAIIEGAKLVTCDRVTDGDDEEEEEEEHNAQCSHDNNAASPDSGFEEHGSLESTSSRSTDNCISQQSNGRPQSAAHTVVTNNNSNSSMDIDNSDDSLPDTPPPLPPRLGRSLGRPADAEEADNPSAGPDNPGHGSKDGEEEVVVKPGRVTEREDFDKEALRTHSEGVDIRRRKREERIKQTSEQIAKMKRKQEDSERWKARKRGLPPYVLGLSIAVLVGGMLLYRFYWTSSS